MYFLHANARFTRRENRQELNKFAELLDMLTGMSPSRHWHLDCTSLSGARDTGDDNITSCSRFSVAVVRTATGHKATQSSHAASPIFFLTTSADHQNIFQSG
jgi:hypothetical protein